MTIEVKVSIDQVESLLEFLTDTYNDATKKISGYSRRT